MSLSAAVNLDHYRARNGLAFDLTGIADGIVRDHASGKRTEFRCEECGSSVFIDSLASSSDVVMLAGLFQHADRAHEEPAPVVEAVVSIVSLMMGNNR